MIEVLVLAMALAPAGAAQEKAADAAPLRVSVIGRTRPTVGEAERKARDKQLKKEEKAAREAAKQLWKRYGKDRKAWPPEARQQEEEAVTREDGAALARYELDAEQKDIDDTAADLRERFATVARRAKIPLEVVGADQPADTRVEVLARREHWGLPAATWYLYIEVTPVSWRAAGLTHRSFSELESRKEYLGQILGHQEVWSGVTSFHPCTEKEPYWIVEVGQQNSHWGKLAYYAAEAVLGFWQTATHETAPANEPAQQD